jgi:DNA-binding response OmpR family regulator
VPEDRVQLAVYAGQVWSGAVEGRVPLEVLVLAQRPETMTGLREELARRGHGVLIAQWASGGAAPEGRRAAASLVVIQVDDLTTLDPADITRLAGGMPGECRVAIIGAGEVTDRVRMLNAGADLCLPAGLSQKELVARLAALLRRTEVRGDHPTLQEGQLTVDLVQRAATYRGRRLNLSPYEYRVLRDLALRVMECRSRFPAAGDDRLTNALRRLSDYAEGLDLRSQVRAREAAHPHSEAGEAVPD